MPPLLIFEKYKVTVLVGCLLFGSCSISSHLIEREQAFGTSGAVGFNFHRLADRDKGVTLAFPGYIVGIEKARWRKIGAPSGKEIKAGAYGKLGFSDKVSLWKNGPLSYQEREIMDDVKPTFVSTIMEYKLDDAIIPHIVQQPIYNAYDPADLNDPLDAYYEGYKALDRFGDQLLQKVKSDNVTHVFLMSMGWNSDQQESIRNFNSLMLKILDQAKGRQDFRPMFIGFTWPSYWTKGSWNPISFFNKSNDADEIGMAAFNLLLNKKLLSLDRDVDFKTIVLGHSFGAKLTSRAVMSASMLSEPSLKVDLLINLQSAYSINRYSVERGAEKTENYQNWKEYVHRIALVCSDYDTAVKAGFYAPFAGSARAYRRTTNQRSKDKYPGIDTVDFDQDTPIAFTKPQQLLLIRANDIINTPAYEKGGGAHSDIYNTEVAALLWQLIESATF